MMKKETKDTKPLMVRKRGLLELLNEFIPRLNEEQFDLIATGVLIALNRIEEEQLVEEMKQ